jgi:hypothetical protein
MYVQIKDWDRGKTILIFLQTIFISYYLAQRIAQANDKALLNDVLIGQAKQSFDNNDFPKAESYLLQAQRPDLAIKLYKDNGIVIKIYTKMCGVGANTETLFVTKNGLSAHQRIQCHRALKGQKH